VSSADSPDRRPVGKPPKTVTDEARAEELLNEMRRAGETIQTETQRRLRLALEANELGVTTTKIGDALGFSHATVSSWIRSARRDAASSADQVHGVTLPQA
jgi:DNA-directed RNA polymerase specialized sigma24 family protein